MTTPEFAASLPRLDALRRDLLQGDASQRAYALETLLARLWATEGQQRLAVACALCGYPPQIGKSDAPLCASRLCHHLSRADAPQDQPLSTPDGCRAWVAQGLASVLAERVLALKSLLRTSAEPPVERARAEAEACLDALRLARYLRAAAIVEPCLHLLRLLSPDAARHASFLSRETTLLREAVARVLGAVDPDSLAPFWEGLASPEVTTRSALLPVLDYLSDRRAVPPLICLLERRFEWTDGTLLGWFIVRALERIGDRSALPVLRRIASGADNSDLALEARRVVQAIEGSREARERRVLLRPYTPSDEQLLHPASPAPDRPEDDAELLRPTDT